MMEELEIRIHGEANRPALVYLPGIHGDWTLVGGFRAALTAHARFVEFSYPRTLAWTLKDYGAAVLTALKQSGVKQGWLLGESFGSQVLWAALDQLRHEKREPAFRPDGIILAGGFVKYPWPWAARFARISTKRLPANAWRLLFRLYAFYARFRHRQTPEILADVHEFIRRRLEPLDRQAIHHRLELIANNDPRSIARCANLPLYSLVGFLDPIVPALPVRRWLRRNYPHFNDSKLMPWADHNVLGSAPLKSAEQVMNWMNILHRPRQNN